jgi:hypothetical protein
MTLKTLADVRTLLRHLPEDRRARSTWRYVAQQLAEAAVGAASPADAPLRGATKVIRQGSRVPGLRAGLDRVGQTTNIG